jgi:S1-C subfamily serine protease
MKGLPGIALAVVLPCAALGGEMASVQIDGNDYTNITDVHISGNGGIFISAANGMTVVSADKLPDDFLKSWNIDKEAAAAAAKSKSKQVQQRQREEQTQAIAAAIAAGCFREVDGVVYDIRRPESGWVRFPDVKIIQVLDDGAIVDLTPESQTYDAVHVKNIPRSLGDTDSIDMIVKLVGHYSFVNKQGDELTLRNYDLGRVCSQDEIPDAVLSDKKAFDLALNGSSAKDVLASLPDEDTLRDTGSGFFITEDGYLITNFHVVKDAIQVKVKKGRDVYPAKVVHFDKDNDLALLKVSGKFNPLNISTNDAQLGEAVFTIGFPDLLVQGTEPKYTDGKISSLAGIQDDPKDFQISVPVQPGNSGGPLVDMSGNVVGVVVAKLDEIAVLSATGDLPQNVNYAVKGKCLDDFLRQFPEIKWGSAEPGTSSTSAIQSTQESVAIVLAY